VLERLSTKALRKKRQAFGALLLGCFLALQALVTLPELHAWVHPDASDPDHECAVTLFAHGQVEAAVAVTPLFIAPSIVVSGPALPKIIFVSTDIRLLPGRGPPASSVLA